MKIHISPDGSVKVAIFHRHAPSCPDPTDPGAHEDPTHLCWMDEYYAAGGDDTPTGPNPYDCIDHPPCDFNDSKWGPMPLYVAPEGPRTVTTPRYGWD